MAHLHHRRFFAWLPALACLLAAAGCGGGGGGEGGSSTGTIASAGTTAGTDATAGAPADTGTGTVTSVGTTAGNDATTGTGTTATPGTTAGTGTTTSTGTTAGTGTTTTTGTTAGTGTTTTTGTTAGTGTTTTPGATAGTGTTTSTGTTAGTGTTTTTGTAGSTTPTPAPVSVVPTATTPAATTPVPVDGHAAIRQAALAQRPGVLAKALGRSQRLLVGLGTVDLAAVQAQKLTPDIYDQYLTGAGPTSWPTWNAPSGYYVQLVAQRADLLGAVPMFTLYQMATRGDGDLSGLTDTSFMAAYWNNARLLFQQLAVYGKPALVNFEPDFWGYAQRANADPTRMFVHVDTNPDCANLPNTVTGFAACLVRTARQYAPKAYVGFPPSLFADLVNTDLAYLQKVGAAQADFVVMQTLDRDAGCFEAQSTTGNCIRNGKGWYWDETNTATPNFKQHFALARTFFEGLGLPLLWWQTPLGVPAAAAGTTGAWRDNRVHYFLTHAGELAAAGGVGAVFSPGESTQTTILSDGGQFKALSNAYFASPTALP